MNAEQEHAVPTDSEGYSPDAHSDRTRVTDGSILALLHEAVVSGWVHTYDRSPFENFRRLVLETTPSAWSRHTYVDFAFAFICGLGPNSAPGALDTIEQREDVAVGAGGECA
jgi:hypothetical protein